MKKEDEFLASMRDRFRLSQENETDLKREALDDMRFAFIPGNQWEESQKKKRGKRPCYEFNRVRQSIKQVTGEQRKNRPQIKIRATEESDKKTADTLQGLIRNIETVSNAERAYDTGFEFAVGGGFGAWRIATDYCAESAFDQELQIKEIRNPFTVWFDPSASEWDRRDGWFAFVTERIALEEYERRYPKAEAVDFDDSRFDSAWFNKNDVQIAEYWVREPVNKTMLLLSDGRTVDAAEFEPIKDEQAAKGVSVIKSREVKSHKVVQYIVSGAEVLEGPNEWAGKFIPIVPVWGDLLNIEGEDYFSGMVRPSKDSQRLYNFNRTAAVEIVAKSPKAPYLATREQIKGYEAQWNASNADDAPYLLFNPDPQAPGLKPQREPGPQVPTALVAMLQLDAEDLKSTSGIFDASLGASSNETSGRAIIARQNQGDTATFEYVDNLSRSIRYTGEILVDLIPRIYDTKRTIRILGEDGTEQFVTLNEEVQDQQTGQAVILNDTSRGRYDVTVTTGPSYATARMELADTLLKVSQSAPNVAPILSDLIVRSLDLPGGDEAVKRLRRMMLQQGIVDPTPEDMEDAQKIPPKPPAPEQELQMRGMKAEVESKEIANAQAMKDLQTPPEQSGGADMARMQLDAHKAQIDAQARVQIEQEKLAHARWEAELQANVAIQKAQIDAQTRLQIAAMDQENKAAIAQQNNETKIVTGFAQMNSPSGAL